MIRERESLCTIPEPVRLPSRPCHGAPPIPREHGGWVMLVAPLLINLLGAPSPPLLPFLLLGIAALSAFCLQHTAGLLIRRPAIRYAVWLGAYFGLLLAGGLPLLMLYHLHDLLPLAVLGAGVFGLTMFLSRTRSRRRFDRMIGGEILGVMALTLTGPAASVVVRGSLDGIAWQLWAGLVLYFTSGVFSVNLLLAAARCKASLDARARWRLGRCHLFYHTLLVLLLGLMAAAGRPLAAILLAFAYLPILLRAFRCWINLDRPLSSLKRVGMGELLYTLWFVGCCAVWLRWQAHWL